ncbi:MAG: hypothetical protein FJ271_03055 [Planctomycetes bacterium]|nr:hypothetical protein [Planctomycetota bacterium]
MGRTMWLGCAAGMCLGLIGCSSDTRETLVSVAVKQMNDAASNMASIRQSVEKWEKEPKEKAKYLKLAGDAAERLKKNGQAFQEIKQQADKLDVLTQQEKEEQAKTFEKSLRGALTTVTKEMAALNQTMARAEKVDKTGISDLREKLRQAQSEFEVLSRQR